MATKRSTVGEAGTVRGQGATAGWLEGRPFTHVELAIASRNGVSPDVVEFLTAYVAAYGSGSLEALRPFYSEDSLIWPNQRPTARGWPDVRAMFAPSFERFAIAARVHLLEVRAVGDERFLRFLTEVRLTPTTGSAPATTAAFRDFALLTREGSTWVIRRNIDQPVTLEQLRADLEHEPPLVVIGEPDNQGG